MSDNLRRAVRPTLNFLVTVTGVVFFDWQLRWILVFYWLETGLTVFRQCTEAVFAGRPNSEAGRVLFPPLRRLREKRGGLPTLGVLPPLYPRTFPTVLLSATVLFAVWLFIGSQIVALGGTVDFGKRISEIIFGVSINSRSTQISFLLGTGAIVVGQAVTFGSNLRTRPYHELSARAIVGPRQIFGPILFLLVFLGGVFLSGGTLTSVRGPVFAVVVAGRTCVDIGDEFGVMERVLPDSFERDTQIGEQDDVPSGDGEPRARWQTDRQSVVVAKALTSPGRVFGNRAGLVVLAIAAFLGVVLDGTAGVAAAVGVVVSVAIVGAIPLVIETDLLYGHLEYRLYDDCLVAYDRLLETPQWRVELDEVRETETDVALLDRLPGLTLERLYVRADDDSQRLVGLADAEGVREAIDTARFE